MTRVFSYTTYNMGWALKKSIETGRLKTFVKRYSMYDRTPGRNESLVYRRLYTESFLINSSRHSPLLEFVRFFTRVF